MHLKNSSDKYSTSHIGKFICTMHSPDSPFYENQIQCKHYHNLQQVYPQFKDQNPFYNLVQTLNSIFVYIFHTEFFEIVKYQALLFLIRNM